MVQHSTDTKSILRNRNLCSGSVSSCKYIYIVRISSADGRDLLEVFLVDVNTDVVCVFRGGRHRLRRKAEDVFETRE